MVRIGYNLPRTACLAVALVVIGAAAASAGDHPPFAARNGLDLAQDAAQVWAEDAKLVYLENDAEVTVDGRATRWGYLFYSERLGKARGYSVRDSKILEAADLGFDFEAYPLPAIWIDSQVAFDVAEEKAGQEYCSENGGSLTSMLLVRGIFHHSKPDMTTWVVVYTSESAPTLVVLVDADEGKVVRTWKG
jgi:hypothetical protein